ncbi:hypothetical protein DXC08_02050 [Clostridium sp. OM07-9AC]|nr:hypothetical protein DXC08_02050 [Clostridium sp. OM07-9AC]
MFPVFVGFDLHRAASGLEYNIRNHLLTALVALYDTINGSLRFQIFHPALLIHRYIQHKHMQVSGNADAVLQKTCLEIYRGHFIVKDRVNIRFSLWKGELIFDAENILLPGSGPGIRDIVETFMKSLRDKSVHSGPGGIVRDNIDSRRITCFVLCLTVEAGNCTNTDLAGVYQFNLTVLQIIAAKNGICVG